MNCKPGDIAVLVRVTSSTTECLGRLFEVLSAADERSYHISFGIDGFHPTWKCRAIGAPVKNYAGRVKREWVIPDFALRPIRDPGEDAQDETLNWILVPTKETA